MSLLAHWITIGSTVGGVLGLLLFSPYHTYFSAYYHTLAQELSCPSMAYRPTCPVWDMESPNGSDAASAPGTSIEQKTMISPAPNDAPKRLVQTQVFVTLKEFNSLKSEMINLQQQLEFLRTHVTSLQNEISILKRSQPKTSLSTPAQLLFATTRK